MKYNHLHMAKSENIAVVVIDRPPVNALNYRLIDELTVIFEVLDGDPDVHVVIITGKGKAFVAGADISEMIDMSVEEAQLFSTKGQEAMNRIAFMDKPVIGALNGYALGGGCELALACDIRLASPNVKLGQPEVKLGVTPGFGGTQRLPRIVGLSTAKSMIFSGRVLTAEDAWGVGLIDKVIEPATKLIPEAKAMAKEICQNSLNAVILAKKLINDGLDVPLNSGLALERTMFGELFSTPDQREGMQAFIKKRKPNFQNR